MIDQSVFAGTKLLLNYLGLDEEPLGVYYDNKKPEPGYGPKPGPPLSRELEAEGKVDFQEVFKCFSCVIGNIWLARKKHCAAYISAKEYGCPGGVFYSAMMEPNLRFIEHYVTTGFPGTPIHGERYLPTPASMQKFLKEVNPRKAPANYCIFKPLSLFVADEEPEFITFFARPEVLTGLFMHTTFTTGEVDSVVSPFGAGCTNIVAWPLYYKEREMEKAVLGGFDPSARKFMKPDELTFTVSWELYNKMLASLAESLFTVPGAWETVRKKITRSSKAWGESD